MARVAISVDCEAALHGKCYSRELVQVAEELAVPLTWLIYSSEKDPISNVDLYHAEYLHRIPAWHELGLLVSFENSSGYVSDPAERGGVLRTARDTVKSRHIKPTAMRAHRGDLVPTDLKHLEDCGILVDVSGCPGAAGRDGVAWAAGPTEPYHPSYEHLSQEGASRVIEAPLTSHGGVCGYLDFGWERLEPLLEAHLGSDRLINLALTDFTDNRDTLRKALTFCRAKHARFITLTQISSEAA